MKETDKKETLSKTHVCLFFLTYFRKKEKNLPLSATTLWRTRDNRSFLFVLQTFRSNRTKIITNSATQCWHKFVHIRDPVFWRFYYKFQRQKCLLGSSKFSNRIQSITLLNWSLINETNKKKIRSVLCPSRQQLPIHSFISLCVAVFKLRILNDKRRETISLPLQNEIIADCTLSPKQRKEFERRRRSEDYHGTIEMH